jgi:hypothetical protein
MTTPSPRTRKAESRSWLLPRLLSALLRNLFDFRRDSGTAMLEELSYPYYQYLRKVRL